MMVPGDSLQTSARPRTLDSANYYQQPNHQPEMSLDMTPCTREGYEEVLA